MIDKNMLDDLNCREIKEMIDENKISLEQLDASTLRKLMDRETDMLCIGKGDIELICRCSDLLDKTDPVPMTDDEFMNIIEKSKKEHIVIADENAKHHNVPKTRFIFKRVALTAAVILILMTSSFAVAGAFGFDICKYISEVVRAAVGTESNADGFTFYHNGEAKEYSSIEEMIKNENLDILYPTKFPDGVKIKSVQIIRLPNNNNLLQIFTSDADVNISIELEGKPLTSSTDDIIEHQGIKFFIEKEETFSASCFHKNNKYYILATTKDDLILIIENLKEKES